MIKSLLGDEEPEGKSLNKDLPQTKKPSEFSEGEVKGGAENQGQSAKTEEKKQIDQAIKPFEVEGPIGTPGADKDKEPAGTRSIERFDSSVAEQESDVELSETKKPTEGDPGELAAETTSGEVSGRKPETIEKVNVHRSFAMETTAETTRKTGLAFSAGVSLFASVVFMMLLGWLFDFFFGTEPWGVVSGIVIGSVVGFVQFFRTTSDIFKPRKSDFRRTSIRSDQNHEDME